MAQLETEKQVGTGVEVRCSQFDVIGPVALIWVEATEVLSRVVQAVTVNVSAVELAKPLALVGPWLKTGSVEEVT